MSVDDLRELVTSNRASANFSLIDILLSWTYGREIGKR
jgi:hypothetical protein